MSNITISPNMNLPVPIVSVDPGPDYASQVNNSLGLIDSHNHAFGNGVQINPDGLNINADLTINSNNLTNLRAVRFTSQATTIPATTPDIREIYVAGADLYYNDGNNNIVRITQSGGVAGSPGSISGLTSPASASYSSVTSTFTFQSGANIPANLDAGAITLRKISTGSPGITIAPSNSLSSSYSLTLPATLPSTQSYATIDNSGNLATPLPLVRPTGTTVGVGGVAVSSSCGFVPLSNATNTQITPFTLTITTIGNPVMINFISDNSASGGSLIETASTTNMNFYNNGTGIATQTCGSPFTTVVVPGSSFSHIDTTVIGVPGTYTYTIFISTSSGSNASIQYTKMVVRELN